jgi:hypothetical protein
MLTPPIESKIFIVPLPTRFATSRLHMRFRLLLPYDRLHIQISNFKFLVSAFPSAPKPSTLDSRLSTQLPYLRDIPSAGFIPSSAVAKDVLLICKYLCMKSGDFLHYILHPY